MLAVAIFQFSSSMVVKLPNFAKKHAVKKFLAVVFWGILHISCRLERSTPPTLASSRGCINISMFFLSYYDVMTARNSSSLTFSCHKGKAMHPTRFYSSLRLYTPNETTFLYVRTIVQYANESSRWNLYNILYFSVHHFLTLSNQLVHPRDVFKGTKLRRLTTTVIVF